ncbi:N-acetylgalactosaminyl transferase, putative [Ixodes scapularis]|uniref:N-acetylgalactosaminyl transferase, putative n=1 Tax=Ixodes scapularis TaxID=6945 RepID=B7PHL3_IXOSC|nr:N-acetylgalactosaminyl transferase, putative [Ixodes scapularis]|eukprot:XP_002403156.1 N-acetylgalactosaminyl transferase, putative [Ixodes scapularis]
MFPQDGDHLDSNAIKDSKPADRRVDEQLPPLARKRAERERPPSKEDDKEAKGPAMQAVLVPPRNPDGPGELGRPVVLSGLTEEQEKRVKKGWDQNAFNQYISDMISLHRSLPDVRDSDVERALRTVHSILDRSPDPLLREIILVDDFSDMPHLKSQLEDYVAHLPKVKIVRAQKREGLIRARLLGAAAATAPVLTYLDSHCECTEGWLEPLLDRIARNSTTVVCPVIDVISDSTFEYHYRDSGGVNVGGFDWNLQFSWHAVPERERKRRLHSWDPVCGARTSGGPVSTFCAATHCAPGRGVAGRVRQVLLPTHRTRLGTQQGRGGPHLLGQPCQPGQHAQGCGHVPVPRTGRKPVLDAEQGRGDPPGRSVPGLCRGRGHPLPLPRLQGQPAVALRRRAARYIFSLNQLQVALPKMASNEVRCVEQKACIFLVFFFLVALSDWRRRCRRMGACR